MKRDIDKQTEQCGQDQFDTIVADYQRTVINICYRFLLNREDAEDVAQEAFIEIYRSLEKFKGESKLSTWIYRIAVTKSIDHIRKKKRKKRFAPVIDIFTLQNDGKEIAATDKGPREQIETEEMKAVVAEAVAALPDNQKIAISLSKIEGLKNKEVAEIMDASVSSVEALIHRGKQNLRKKLEKYYDVHRKKQATLMLFLLCLSLIGIYQIKKYEKKKSDTAQDNRFFYVKRVGE
mgnify:CR=1 FL=1